MNDKLFQLLLHSPPPDPQLMKMKREIERNKMLNDPRRMYQERDDVVLEAAIRMDWAEAMLKEYNKRTERY